jgi:hypothetical protein
METISNTPVFTSSPLQASFKGCEFVAHTCEVYSPQEARVAHEHLAHELRRQGHSCLCPCAFRTEADNNIPEDLGDVTTPGQLSTFPPSEDFDDSGDFGVGSKLLFLLKRSNAMNLLLVVSTITSKSILPESLGVRRYKFIVMAAKLGLESVPGGVGGGDFGGDSVSNDSSTLGSLDAKQLGTFNLSVRRSPSPGEMDRERLNASPSEESLYTVNSVKEKRPTLKTKVRGRCS